MATVFFGEDFRGNDNIGLPGCKIFTRATTSETVFDGLQTTHLTGLVCPTASYDLAYGKESDVGINTIFVTPGAEIIDKGNGDKYKLSLVIADDMQEAIALLALGFMVKL